MKKLNVAVLGATGIVGQNLVSLLDNHPWFRLAALCASPANAGRRYDDAVQGRWQPRPSLPSPAADLILRPCAPPLDADIVFSALDSSVAGPIEEDFARGGHLVCSNAANHRMRSDVPLVVPEVNRSHLSLLERQNYQGGGIVTNPNCSTIGLVLALAPLHQKFGVKKAAVTTLQAISGAGYPGLPALDILDNIIPLIQGEEEKIETETLKILGTPAYNADIAVSAQCNRVPVSVGHLLNIAVELDTRVTVEDVAREFDDFNPLGGTPLPSAPARPLLLLRDPGRPQPARDRANGGGMTVTIGRLREDSVLHFRFVALVDNLIRGAAGAALLNAELLVRQAPSR